MHKRIAFQKFFLTSETFIDDLVGAWDIRLDDKDAFDLVTDLANLANLLNPEIYNSLLCFIYNTSSHYLTYTPYFLCLIFDRLLQSCDVSEGAEEEHNNVPLILDWRYVHQ